DLFWRKLDLVLLRLLHDGVDNFLVALMRIRPTHHRDVVQVILERIIGQLRRNDLKAAVDDRDDRQKSDERFDCSHVPQSTQQDAEMRLMTPGRALPENVPLSPKS